MGRKNSSLICVKFASYFFINSHINRCWSTVEIVVFPKKNNKICDLNTLILRQCFVNYVQSFLWSDALGEQFFIFVKSFRAWINAMKRFASLSRTLEMNLLWFIHANSYFLADFAYNLNHLTSSNSEKRNFFPKIIIKSKKKW